MISADAPQYLWIFTNAVALLSALGWVVNWYRGQPRAEIGVRPDWEGQASVSDAAPELEHSLPLHILNTGSGEARDVCIYMASGSSPVTAFRTVDGQITRTHWVGELKRTGPILLNALSKSGRVQLMITWKDGPGKGKNRSLGAVIDSLDTRRVTSKRVPKNIKISTVSHPHGLLDADLTTWPNHLARHSFIHRLSSAIRAARRAYRGEIND